MARLPGPDESPFVIAGAGIGGLTAALALAKAGIRVVILEQAESLEAIGAGIQLSPNASRILFELGLGSRLAAAVRPEAISIRRADGAPLARIPLGAAAEARYGAPYLVMHRGELQTALLGAVREAGIAPMLGVRVEGFVEDGPGITVRAADGREFRARGLVGADGVRSRLRVQLGGGPPRFTGRIAWRATIPGEAAGPSVEAGCATGLWLGARAHLVHYRLSGSRINLVAVTEGPDPGATWSAPGEPAEIRRRFTAWAREARDLVAAAETWRVWPLHDGTPAVGAGRATLLGDAAHPMLPFLAQGGAMAIEDAAVLAAMLARTPDVADAFRRYEAARGPRTARVVRAARRNAWAYHLSGLPALARDTVLRFAGDRLLAGYDWLYGWRAPGA